MTATVEAPDDFADLLTGDGVVEAQPGPLTGSRGTNKPAGRAGGATRTSTRLQKKLDVLQKKLSGEMFAAGSLVGMGLPVTGYYVCQESDTFTKAVVELASSRPEWIEALDKLANIGPGITIGRVVLGMGASLAVDRGRVDPEKSRAMRFLGVYAAWSALNEGRDVSVNGTGSGYVSPPAPAFRPV